tara:strand:- start:156 stop:695 length:540 start_codon:yes stop_codon:yes gene_type:complete
MRIFLSIILLLNSNFLYSDDEFKDDSNKVIQHLAQNLKKTLVNAIKNKGLVGAVELCNIEAPIISQNLSTKNLKVSRIASKNRNPENKATQEQEQVLKFFEQEIALGKSPKNLYKVVETQDSMQYLKPIVTGKVCLACHGSNVSGELKAKINKLYPNDLATGFEEGSLRGAFLVEKFQK